MEMIAIAVAIIVVVVIYLQKAWAWYVDKQLRARKQETARFIERVKDSQRMGSKSEEVNYRRRPIRNQNLPAENVKIVTIVKYN